MFWEPGVNLVQPFLSNKVFGCWGECFICCNLFSFKSGSSFEQAGTDEVFNLHESLLVGAAAINVKFHVIKSKKVLTLCFQVEGGFDQINDPVEGGGLPLDSLVKSCWGIRSDTRQKVCKVSSECVCVSNIDGGSICTDSRVHFYQSISLIVI